MIPQGFEEPGTYKITVGRDNVTTVKVDSLDYGGADGGLRAFKDGKVVAEFRWWESVVRTGD